MNNFYTIFIIWTSFLTFAKFSLAKDVKLSSRDFQKEFLQKVSDSVKSQADDYLQNFLKEIETKANMSENIGQKLKLAVDSQKLETKIVFIKQYLDMEEHKDSSRENMYALRNVIFLKKLKNKLHALQEETFAEMHHLRYFYLCREFKGKTFRHNEQLQLSNNEGTKLANKLTENIHVNITEFGIELYKKVNETGSVVIDDYLITLKKLLLEVVEPQSEEEDTLHSQLLRKILVEIDHLLKTSDFYKKRQRLYDYLQNHLAVDYEQIHSSENTHHDIMEIFNKLKEKGLDLVTAYLFSNFEFTDYVQDQWTLLLPQAQLSQYDAESRQLKQIQQFYAEFKQDFENTAKYEAYLELLKLLYEQTQLDHTDHSHIYEMLYSAAQNVGSSRAPLMNSKCNEI